MPNASVPSWLKHRKGRTLSADDLTHYHRIVVALRETIRLMADIDRLVYDLYGLTPAEIKLVEEATH